jgi:lipid-binding SYLF domain-containing protein
LAAAAESAWESIKKGVGDTVDSVSEAAKSVTEEESPAESRAKIDKMAKQTLNRLLSENVAAKKLLEQSYGYAVFDTRKFSFLITTGFGAGVAVERSSGKRTYMKMATGGANIGMGGEFYQLVILFERHADFQRFIDEGYEAGTGASAVAGEGSLGTDVRFTDGTAVFQLTEVGLKLAADVTGTKYWKDEDLN